MKRFLSLLTVFVLAFALAVPVGAVSDGNALYGDLELPVPPAYDAITYPYSYLTEDNGVINFVTSNKAFKVGSNSTIAEVKGPAEQLWFKLENGNWGEPYVEKIGSAFSWTKPLNEFMWANYDIVDSAGNVYLDGVAIFNPNAICDGSSCPAADVNFDDICDDCGMPLAYNLRVTPNTYEVVVKHSDSLTLKYSYTETLAGTSFNAVYNDNRITVSFDNPVNHYQYKLVDGEWTDYASYPNQYGTHTISLSGDASVLASDMDIYDSNGDLFFQNPLWMTVEKVTQGEMENLTSETGGTMKVLVVCGVGLMACLMALNLFGKRWLLFLR